MAKTSRFTSVVGKAGRPRVHLLWKDPKKDAALQKAIKAQRVMMVHQETVGTGKDFGTVGFDARVAGQILVFPKSLADFAESRIVGVNYDLIEEEHAAKPAARAKKKPVAKERPSRPTVEAPPLAAAPKQDAHPEVARLKREIQRAIALLEKGKQIAAFQLLQRLVE